MLQKRVSGQAGKMRVHGLDELRAIVSSYMAYVVRPTSLTFSRAPVLASPAIALLLMRAMEAEWPCRVRNSCDLLAVPSSGRVGLDAIAVVKRYVLSAAGKRGLLRCR